MTNRPTCEECGKEFTPRCLGQIYCSVKCRDRAIYPISAFAPFAAKRSWATSTQPSASTAKQPVAVRNISPVTPRGNSMDIIKLTKKCSICGRMFTPERAGDEICSAGCARRFKKMLRKSTADARKNLRAGLKADRLKTKTCVICGKEFQTAYGKKITCSPECAKEHKRSRERKPALPPRKCKICGKEFTPRNQCQITCSPECSKERNRQTGDEWRARVRRLIPPTPGICRGCGKEFTPDDRRRVYCSEECRRKDKPETRFAPERRTCPTCGKEFTAQKYNQVYCSPNCYFDHKNSGSADLARRICPVCGKKFKTRVHNKTYCSRPCYLVANGNKKLDYAPRSCSVCGKTFTPTKFTQKCCSDKCRIKAGAKIHHFADGWSNTKRIRPSNIDQHAREAEVCGMSYGKYVGLLRCGRTFEQLRPDDWQDRLKRIEERKPPWNAETHNAGLA